MNPIKAAFNNLKSNAKRRGIDFGLSVLEFKEFCDKTLYMQLKGLDAESMTIDRKNDWLGYSSTNIQIMSRSDNSRKAKKGKAGKRPEYRPDDVPF